MTKVKVKRYIRDGKYVSGYMRRKRPKGKKKIIGTEKFVQVRDEYGRVLGFKPVDTKRKRKK